MRSGDRGGELAVPIVESAVPIIKSSMLTSSMPTFASSLILEITFSVASLRIESPFSDSFGRRLERRGGVGRTT